MPLGVEGEKRPLPKSGVGVNARDRGVEGSSGVQDGDDGRVATAVRELLVEAVVVKVVIEDSPLSLLAGCDRGVWVDVLGGRRGREVSLARTFCCS